MVNNLIFLSEIWNPKSSKIPYSYFIADNRELWKDSLKANKIVSL